MSNRKVPDIVWGHQLLIYYNRENKRTDVHLEEYEDDKAQWNPQIVFELKNVATLEPRGQQFKMVFKQGYTIVLPIHPNKWIGIRPHGHEHGLTHRLVFCPRTHRIKF
jgi:hypothetical protein